MSDLQETILNIIINIANTPKAFDFGNSATFPLRNYISRYSLANDEYYVTEKAFQLFEKHNLTSPMKRSKLKKMKKYFTYEHPVPSSVILKLIKSSNKTPKEIKAILKIADCVTLVTKEEDKQISKLHKSKMPKDWHHLTCSQFARYELCNVKIRKEKISVNGALLS
jgi:hypothetical protein